MSSIASNPCDYDMMVIMKAMIIAMIKSRMGMRATILEENMRKMVNIALMVNMKSTKNLVMTLMMMMMEHVRDLTPTPRVNMVPMIVSKHITLPTPRMKVSQSGVYGYTSSSQSHQMGRRECATLMYKDTIFYTSHVNSHLSGYRNQGRYEGCVKGLDTKRVSFPIFKGRRDPEAYLDWEWQCEKNFQNHDLRGNERSMYALIHFKSLALSWWKQAGKLRTLNGNANPLTWKEFKGIMRFKYVPQGYTKLYNVDPRRQVLRMKVDICGVMGFDIGLDDYCNLNHITPSTDSYVGTSMMNGGTQAPNKEPTLEDVMDALLGCHNIPKGVSFQGKEDLSCEHHCTIAKLNIFTTANEQIGEFACFNSPTVVDHSLFKYNILIEKDEITYSDVPSGVNHESGVVLDSYVFYSNPIWCEDCPPKDENLFLEDESTLVGKDHDEKEGGMCFPITSLPWCISILNGMTSYFEPISSHTHENTLDEVDLRDTILYYLFTYDDAHAFEWSMLLEDKSVNRAKGGVLNPSSWNSFPLDHDGELNCGTYVVILGQDDKYHLDGSVDTFPNDGKSFLRVYNPL
ncbi:hypothetical protein KY289_016855 [Solanum tuberosum]|nr:hypothetical protein KY289_016855 [Solanum tuberosum]